MDLHPYDGVNRRFLHTDIDRTAGFDVIARILRLPISLLKNDILYDLSFYSGGVGIIDRLAISLPADVTLWASIIDKLGAKTIEAANQNSDWASDLAWLVSDGEDDEEEENELIIVDREAAIKFVNGERYKFQTSCKTIDRIYFTEESNVNSWCALWGEDRNIKALHYLVCQVNDWDAN